MSEPQVGEQRMAVDDQAGTTADGNGNTPPASSVGGLTVPRVFSREGVHPFDEIAWERRTAEIKDDKGGIVFRQENFEVPASWSQRATDIVAEKYAYGALGTPEREASVRQIIGRVSRTIVLFGLRHGWFASRENAQVFQDELDWLLVNQHYSLNSPVWFNVGVRPGTGWAWDFEAEDVVRATDLAFRGDTRYQGSACFITSADDSMESIGRNAGIELHVFKYGSGVGCNRSNLRSSRESVTGGGKASGPVSFMRIYDAVAAVTRSGGITRRAAKLEALDANHPDILEFIRSKTDEERKARALIREGYEADFNGDAYGSVLFQNSNLSVRASDVFMEAVQADAHWQTQAVVTGTPLATDGTPMPVYRASDLMDEIARGTWECGDPGMLYGDAMERWNTIPNAGPIRCANPCIEYQSIDDSSCNLGSHNLLKYRLSDGTFDVRRFRAAVRISAIAQDILVDLGSYPTPEIARNAHRHRQLGPGYANLGALIMSLGLPYDSDQGRALAGVITSILTGQGYLTSAEMAASLGPFDGFEANREPMLRVMGQHRNAGWGIEAGTVDEGLRSEVYGLWRDVLACGERHGFRNSEMGCIAPTGTISFAMDCDTTGVEPEIALVKYKNLWGRGKLRMVNQTVPMALESLGYSRMVVARIVKFIDGHDTIEGCPDLLDEHIPVFDCSFPPANGPLKRSIHWRGHVRMLAAIQPHLAMCVSKTINMPADATVADIRAAYIEGWKLGLKALAIYRDGCKGSQPVSTSKDGKVRAVVPVTDDRPVPRRERLPDTRQSVTHKGSVSGVEFYLTVGLYPDGRPGEVFVTMAKEGSTIGGMMDQWATAMSISLQYGVPIDVLVNKFRSQRFEPHGATHNPEIPFAWSLIDYIARWLGRQYVKDYQDAHAPKAEGNGHTPAAPAPVLIEAPSCTECGNVCVPTGRCWTCGTCGTSQGGCG